MDLLNVFVIFTVYGTTAISAANITSPCMNKDWKPLDDFCYKVFTKAMTWEEAKISCRSNSSDLVSMNSIKELNWITALIAEVPYDGFWIGLTYNRTHLYQWSDGSKVSIVHWSSKMRRKRPWDQRNCAFIESDNEEDPGYWSLSTCEMERSYVCKAKNMGGYQRPLIVQSGCKKNMKSWRNRCYWFVKDQLGAKKANETCSKQDGHLLQIQDLAELYYVKYLLSGHGTNQYWTAFKHNRFNGLFEWSTGSKMDLSSSQLGLKQIGTGNCGNIKMTGDYHEMVLSNCSHRYPSLCKKLRDGFNSSSTLKSRKRTYCPPNWISVPFSNKCLWSSETAQLPWEQANNYCKSISGNLIEADSQQELLRELDFIDALDTQNWIGLKSGGADEKESDIKLANGRKLKRIHLSWINLQPHVNNNPICYAVERVRLRYKYYSLDDLRVTFHMCNQVKSFVCQTYKSDIKKAFLLPPEATVTKPPPSKCPDGQNNWLYFNGFCYFTSNYLTNSRSSKKTWHSARQYCIDNRADLLSVHYDTEHEHILKVFQLGSKGSRQSAGFWNGLNSLDFDSAFTWSDRTPLNYIQWDINQPKKDPYTRQKCAKMSSTNGLWKTENCQLTLDFGCKRLADPTVTVSPPSIISEHVFNGSCLSGWWPFGNKCYKLFNEENLSRKTWKDAFEYCRSLGPSFDLVSIHSQAEQEFTTMLIERSVWIGLSDRRTESRFYWTDNTEVSYTAWNKGEPNDFQSYGAEDCVEMFHDKHGRWNDAVCTFRRDFICQTFKDPTKSQNSSISDHMCKDGYKRFRRSCYKLVDSDRKLPWKEAQEECKRDNADLVSIHSYQEMLVVKFLMDNSYSAWIGMNNLQGKSPWKWVAGWPVSYSKWDTYEPASGTKDEPVCAYIKKSGSWKTSKCKLKRSYVCEISDDPPPRLPNLSTGPCPNKKEGWLDIEGEKCYDITLVKMQWTASNSRCDLKGSNLLAIHSAEEARILSAFLKKQSNYVWIGMYITIRGVLKYHDGSPVDYVNWDTGEPKNTSSLRNACVSMNKATLKWKISNCYTTLSTICYVYKDAANVIDSGLKSKIESSAPPDQTGLSSGVMAGYSILGLFLAVIIVVVVMYFVIRRIRNNRSTARYHSHGLSINESINVNDEDM